MTVVRFRPWVGDQYGRLSRWELSVLLLGESHYDEGFGQGEHLTEFVVRRHVRREGKQYPFWTKIAKTFVGPMYESAADRRSFWQSVAFYNYVQEFAGTGPRQRPTPRQFRSAWLPFSEVVGELRPDVVVVLGFGLWDALDPLLASRSALDVPAYGGRSGTFATLPQAHPGVGVTGFIKHPSAAFRPDDWRSWVSALMGEARKHVE